MPIIEKNKGIVNEYWNGSLTFTVLPNIDSYSYMDSAILSMGMDCEDDYKNGFYLLESLIEMGLYDKK